MSTYAQIWQNGTLATLLSTELDHLPAGKLALGAPYTAGAGAMWAEFELCVSYPLAPSQPCLINLWMLRAIDGSNYEDGSALVLPARVCNLTFQPRSVAGLQRITIASYLPAGNWAPLLQNLAPDQPFGTGNLLRLLPALASQ